MKRTLLYIAFFLLASCSFGEREVAPAHGLVQVEIASHPATRADDEAMNTVRLIVFTDLDAAPRAEINRLYSASEFTLTGDPARARFVLAVERRKSNKLVVAVINEPARLSPALAAVAAPGDLDGLEFEMTDFLDPLHQTLKPGAAIPMTGALWTDRLFRSEDEAGRAQNIHRMEVERVVARVDVHLAKGTDVDPDLKLGTSSTVILANTFTRGNLFHHSGAQGTIGSIPTVTANFRSTSWARNDVPTAIDEDVAVCSFYTPERTHTANRLKIILGILTDEEAPRTGLLEIVTARDPQGVERTVDPVLRNHIYKITATVGTNEITARVEDWTDKNINTEF